MLRSSRRVCHVPCCGPCRLAFPSPSVWAVRFPGITTGRGSVILTPNHHEKENVGFQITCEEWEELSGLDSPTLLCQRPEQQRQQHQTNSGLPRAPHTLEATGLFFPLAKRFGKVGRHHHHAHTPHLALPLVSLPLLFFFFSHSMSPLVYRFRMNANSTIICPCVLGRKTSMRNLFGAAGSARKGFSPHLP